MPGEPLTFGLLQTLASGWIADKATGGIISEYAKKGWFRLAHRNKAITDQTKVQTSALKTQFRSASKAAEIVIEENEKLDDLVKQQAAEIRKLEDLNKQQAAQLRQLQAEKEKLQQQNNVARRNRG